MRASRLVLCSGADGPANLGPEPAGPVLTLDSLGSDPNVNISLENVSDALFQNIAPRLVDFLEIASYVFSADTATPRGSGWVDQNSTESWDRSFHFVIPVREPDFWSSPAICKQLVAVLQFLSDDRFAFEFPKLDCDRPTQEYLEFDPHWPDFRVKGVDHVVMFSGGLDSLAGVARLASQGQNLVLVSHRPVTFLSTRQKKLFEEVKRIYPQAKIAHVPVWINKSEEFRRESTQRTRSFLFAALGTVVAHTIGVSGVQFFENGVVSLNLPLADEVVRARASRTTHPRTLALLSQLCSAITDREFTIENPFLYHTKTEVVQEISRCGASCLIGKTVSCTQTMFQSSSRPHCGTCSQCIDRRIAVLAAGQHDHDPESDYVCDVFTGQRRDNETNVAIDYIRHANEMREMTETSFATQFNLHLSRATRHLPKRAVAGQRLFELHRRHAESVMDVVTKQVERHAAEIANGALNPTSLLALVCGGEHREPSWSRYAIRLGQLLAQVIPVQCEGHQPKDEPELQQMCDGILRSSTPDLRREFPFLRWSSKSTKPDWSAEALSLWVEMKYVRRKEQVRRITEEIAADITKYGDNNRRVLFVVYDPSHYITDDKEFAAPITSRPTMMVQLVR